MRVALLTYSTKPRGGVVHTLALAEALARRGVDVHVWTLGRSGDTAFFRPVDPAVTVHTVPFEAREHEDVGARIVRSISVLRQAFDHAGYDVVHAQDCISANAALPCVRTIHHLDQFSTPELAACHERAIVAPFARICVSGSVAREVYDGWGFHPTVIPNGVDATRFSDAVSDVQGRDGWRTKLGRYVLALGGIEPRKGSIDLLVAMAQVQQGFPDVRLVFAGGETLFDYRSYRDEFDRTALGLALDHEVLGVIDDDDLPTLVAEASALGFVSTKEGFGLAALEALAAGVPVVARDLPVLREVFGEAVDYAVSRREMAERIEAILEGRVIDPTLGRSLAASYTWDAAAAAHVEFYGSL